MYIDAGELLTRIKKKVCDSKHLDDRNKQIVIHLLKLIYKELREEEKKEEEENREQATPRTPPSDDNPFSDLFGTFFKK